MLNKDFLFYAPICIGVGIVAYFLFIKKTKAVPAAFMLPLI